MIGLGILLRILRRLLGKRLENTGALPTRYYLGEILRSLDHDNMEEAVKLLKMSRGALIDKSRWELVRQQVLFRCRVLMERHGRRIRLIEDRVEALKNHRKRPWQWLRKDRVENLTQYEEILSLEKRARALLESHERELKDIA
jgi:hypothetical protein